MPELLGMEGEISDDGQILVELSPDESLDSNPGDKHGNP